MLPLNWQQFSSWGQLELHVSFTVAGAGAVLQTRRRFKEAQQLAQETTDAAAASAAAPDEHDVLDVAASVQQQQQQEEEVEKGEEKAPLAAEVLPAAAAAAAAGGEAEVDAAAGSSLTPGSAAWAAALQALLSRQGCSGKAADVKWRVIMPDGDRLGPFSAADMQAWLLQGRAPKGVSKQQASAAAADLASLQLCGILSTDYSAQRLPGAKYYRPLGQLLPAVAGGLLYAAVGRADIAKGPAFEQLLVKLDKPQLLVLARMEESDLSALLQQPQAERRLLAFVGQVVRREQQQAANEAAVAYGEAAAASETAYSEAVATSAAAAYGEAAAAVFALDKGGAWRSIRPQQLLPEHADALASEFPGFSPPGWLSFAAHNPRFASWQAFEAGIAFPDPQPASRQHYTRRRELYQACSALLLAARAADAATADDTRLPAGGVLREMQQLVQAALHAPAPAAPAAARSHPQLLVVQHEGSRVGTPTAEAAAAAAAEASCYDSPGAGGAAAGQGEGFSVPVAVRIAAPVPERAPVGPKRVFYGKPACHLCGERGHAAHSCSTPFCQRCDMYGHAPADCADACERCGRVHSRSDGVCRTFQCAACGLFSHKAGHCPSQQCSACGMLGHSDRHCQAHRHCNMCGENGHLPAECPLALLSRQGCSGKAVDVKWRVIIPDGDRLGPFSAADMQAWLLQGRVPKGLSKQQAAAVAEDPASLQLCGILASDYSAQRLPGAKYYRPLGQLLPAVAGGLLYAAVGKADIAKGVPAKEWNCSPPAAAAPAVSAAAPPPAVQASSKAWRGQSSSSSLRSSSSSPSSSATGCPGFDRRRRAVHGFSPGYVGAEAAYDVGMPPGWGGGAVGSLTAGFEGAQAAAIAQPGLAAVPAGTGGAFAPSGDAAGNDVVAQPGVWGPAVGSSNVAADDDEELQELLGLLGV
ncbi:hypothetical protein OEZ86_000267 [Tetradesmus obliquus]|nr:hypothetical protein OEZ86_000267 [Tetradesmus obliquus]